MDTALPQKIPFILDRNLAKANCTGNHVCTSCDRVVLGSYLNAFNASMQIIILDTKHSYFEVISNYYIELMKVIKKEN